jgi:hypothetical protein
VNSFLAIKIDENTIYEREDVILDKVIVNKPKFKKGYSISIHTSEGKEFKFIADYSSCFYQNKLNQLSKGDNITVKYLNYYDLRSLFSAYKFTFDLEKNSESFTSKKCIYNHSNRSKWLLLFISPVLLFILLFFLKLGQKD